MIKSSPNHHHITLSNRNQIITKSPSLLWRLILTIMMTIMMQVLEIFYENYKRQGDQTKNFVFHPGPNKLVSFHHKHMLAFITFIIKIILDIWRYVYDIWFMTDIWWWLIATYFRYSGYVYDAVWLYARVLDALIRKDKSLVQVKRETVSVFCLNVGFSKSKLQHHHRITKKHCSFQRKVKTTQK